MQKTRRLSQHLLPLFIVVSLFLNGCAYGILDDKRLLDTMTTDSSLSSSIKTALLHANFSKGYSVSVYSYYRHVFLIGELPAADQEKAIRIAQSKKPRSVTTHWFSKKTAETGNFVLSSRLRTALIGAKGLSSTRVDTEVNAGRVVLLGVVGSEEERKVAIRTAREVEGVTEVTSYLMLPPHPSEIDTAPEGESFKGKKKKEAVKIKTGSRIEERTI